MHNHSKVGNKKHSKLLVKGSIAKRRSTPKLSPREADNLHLLLTTNAPVSKIKKVFKNGTAVDSYGSEGNAALHVLCMSESVDMEILTRLVSLTGDVSLPDKFGWTPLHYACKKSKPNYELIRYLIRSGADIRAKNQEGTTPLHYFVRATPKKDDEKEYSALLHQMIDSDVYINAQNINGETPLHSAVSRGNRIAFEIFVKRGAKLDISNKYGETALHYAVMANDECMVDRLLDLGVDPGVPSVSGTCLDVAISIGNNIIILQIEEATKASQQSFGSMGISLEEDLLSLDSLNNSYTSTQLKAQLLKYKRNWEIDFKEISLGDMIGSGGFGAVYKAEWRGTKVAVKRVHSVLTAGSFADDFYQEIHTFSLLRHPNIVQFLGASLKDPNVCIVTEFLAKGDLRRVLNKEKDLEWLLRVKMGLRAARGMLYLHMNNPPIVHRDLKSPNLLVDKSYNVKVADFGLSRAMQEEDEVAGGKGTIAWMAPEVLNGLPYCQAGDVYSFGVILWELYTMEFPWKEKKGLQVALAIAKGESLKVPEDCDEVYASLVHDCLKTKPKQRPGMLEVVTRLKAYKSDLNPKIKKSPKRPKGEKLSRSRREREKKKNTTPR